MKTTHIIALLVGFTACVTDVKNLRIPNVLTFGAAVLGTAFQVATDGTGGLVQALAGCAVGLAAFVVPFALGGLGGGDVKLLAALGAWAGPQDAVWIALYSGVAGGILAIVTALVSGYLKTALANVRRLLVHWKQVGISPLPDLTLE